MVRSSCGLIGFVGFIVPHVLRRLFTSEPADVDSLINREKQCNVQSRPSEGMEYELNKLRI